MLSDSSMAKTYSARPVRALVFGLVFMLFASCSVLKMSRLRPDWETADRQTLKHVAVVVQPLPGNDEKVGAMFARLARRYVHQKKEFLLVSDVARAAPPADKATDCVEHIDGVLWLQPTATPQSGGFSLDVKAFLMRCSDWQEVWASEGGGSFSSQDEGLKEVAASYAREFGEPVEPYVAPTMRLLRPMLDTLPSPQLTKEEQDEKITLDE
jgi:probable lipoprotein (TIGR04455 family)